jgi:hypothetical protein
MALQPDAPKAQAVWNDEETTQLVAFLYDHQSEGEGGNFKQPTYNAAALHIAGNLTAGPVKTGTMCKTKWNGVCYLFFIIFII